MIECTQLAFGYQARQPVYQALDLRLETPGIIGLLGFNGAGKTTLLHLLSGLRFPWSGECLLDGRSPRRREAAFLEQICFVPETLELPAQPLRRWLEGRAPFYPRFDYELFFGLLEEFSLSPDRRLSELSLGFQKKAMLAFSLATRARFLLLDEPTNGLDIPGKAALRRMWAKYLPEDSFLILSTHQVRELGAQMDRLLILDEGHLLLNASVGELEELVSFARHPDRPHPEALYFQPAIGGYHCLYPPGHPLGGAEPDLELFCNAVFEIPGLAQQLNP